MGKQNSLRKFTGMECMSLVVLLLLGWTCCPVTAFDAVQWSTEISSSQQCGTEGSFNPTDALQTVAQLIKNTTTSSSLPKSCMEIKENSPVSLSGYYTISNESGESGVVVYCNMDNLYSCPALEQTLSGIMKNVDTLFTQDDSLALEQTLSGIKDDVDSLFTHIDNTSASLCLDGPLASSCLDVKKRCPQFGSGVYEISTGTNNSNFVYCTFESTYCDVTGPWVKLTSWDIAESGTSCPNGLQLFVNGTVSACGLPDGTPVSCQSFPLLSSPVQYTQVCGRMIGYQKGSTDGFWGPQGSGINDPYVDGVSITRGSPRQHIWTYAAGVQENLFIPYQYQCPCVNGSTHAPPPFVGSDYYCESGCPAYWDGTTFHAADPLWDGEGCGSLEPDCCAPPGLPWFHKVFDPPTSDYIEMRMCTEEGSDGENVLLSSYEIYVL